MKIPKTTQLEPTGTVPTKLTFAEKLRFWSDLEDLKMNLTKAGVPEEFWHYSQIPDEYYQ